MSLYKLNYFPKPYIHNKDKIKVELLNLSSYTAKSNLESAASIDTSKFDLDSFKSDVDKLVTDKLEPTFVNWCKLSNVVKNDVVKKNVNNKLLKKVNAAKTIDTSDLV